MTDAAGSRRAIELRGKHGTARTRAARRGFPVFYFLTGLVSATLLLMQHTAFRDTNAFQHAVSHVSLSFPFYIPQQGEPSVSAEQDPSAFDQEMQMTARQLLDRWNPLVQAASKRFGVPVAWIRAVIARESGGRTMASETQPIVSSAGAQGLMQLMPDTYKDMAAQYGLGADPFNPKDNIIAGTAYLRWLHGKYGFPAMFAAYNDGPGNYEKSLANKKILPAETVAYIKGIAGKLGYGFAGRAKLTQPNGRPVMIAGSSVTSIRAPFRHEFVSGVRAVIRIGKHYQGVRESVAEVRAALSPSGSPTRMASSGSARSRIAAIYR